MTDVDMAGNAVWGRRRVWVPLATVALLLLLIAFESVADRLLPGGEALPSGTVLAFGAERDVSVQVGDGWTLDKADTSLDSNITLVRGDLTVRLATATFESKPTVREMWHCFEQVLSISRAAGQEVWIGDPSAFDTSSAPGGLYGPLQVSTRVGNAIVLPAPDGRHAVEATVLAPLHTGDADRAAAAQLIDSIAFEGASS